MDGYQIKQMQLQRAIGELRALVALYYEPMQGATEDYRKIKGMTETFIDELKGDFG